MKVELRVTIEVEDKATKPKRGTPPKLKEEVRYTPALIDASRIDFAYVDEENDLNIRFAGSEDYFTVRNSDKLLDKIDAIIERKFPEVRGLR